MDTRKLTEILRATIDPNQRQQAEEQLSQVSHPHAPEFYNAVELYSTATCTTCHCADRFHIASRSNMPRWYDSL